MRKKSLGKMYIKTPKFSKKRKKSHDRLVCKRHFAPIHLVLLLNTRLELVPSFS